MQFVFASTEGLNDLTTVSFVTTEHFLFATLITGTLRISARTKSLRMDISDHQDKYFPQITSSTSAWLPALTT